MWNNIFMIIFALGNVIFLYGENYPKLAIFSACCAGWIMAFSVANYDMHKELIELTRRLQEEEAATHKED